MGSGIEEPGSPLPKEDGESKKLEEEHNDADRNNTSEKHSDESVIAFESLNTAEKEALVKKLRSEILKDEGPSENFCFAFIDWIFEQFGINRSAPPSTVLTTNLEYLREKFDTKGIFIEAGDSELQKMYYESMVNSVEPDYKREEIDIHSLAFAVLKYLKTNVEFVDAPIYQQLALAYKTGEEKNYICKRLPFVMANRYVFAAIVSLLDDIKQHENNNMVSEDQARKVFSDCVFHWRDESAGDPMEASQKKEVFNDLLDAEFDYVSHEFYR